ncbi:ATP-binding protein [Candidatus Omnitrophota bacterium]
MPVKILIIEDERDHAFLTKTILQQASKDYLPEFVCDPREGLARAEKEKPDVIICDYRMPELSGLDVLRALRKKGIDTPFIVATASGNEKIAVEFMKEGASDYILKDIAYVETLYAVIEKSLSRYRMQKEKERLEEEVKKAYGQLKQTQKELIQSEKLAALGTFSSGVAHEVKNPLAIILGGVEFLEMSLENADEDAKMAITKIKDAALRADTIIQGLLKFAQPSETSFERVEPQTLINDTLELMKYRCPLQNIRIATTYAKSLFVMADKNQFQQVLFNVLMNAVEAMPEGGTININTQTAVLDPKLAVEDACAIVIRDSGTGISAESLTRLFEPFFTTKRDKKGTGLGLSIAKTIVNNHSGDFIIDSKPDNGTSVTIILPLAA